MAVAWSWRRVGGGGGGDYDGHTLDDPTAVCDGTVTCHAGQESVRGGISPVTLLFRCPKHWIPIKEESDADGCQT